MTTQYAIQIVGKDLIEINPAMEIPDLGPTQILLEIEACGICFSDTKLMHAFDNHPRKTPIIGGLTPAELAQIPTYRPGTDPVVPGHEPAGRVIKVGEDVSRYAPGERVLIQTDYRHLPTAGSNGAFGYGFDGGLEQYALVDMRMIIDPVTDESCLIPLGEEPSRSSVALIEPWACVETAYATEERRRIKDGGALLVFIEPGFQPQGLEEVIAGSGHGLRLDCSAYEQIPDEDAFDDIIYVGANADTVEQLSQHLNKQGLMNIVTCGETFDRDVEIDAGRIHYDLIRYAGTTSSNAADGYLSIPRTYDLRESEHLAVIGAGGPMGLMHTVRAAVLGVPGIRIDAVDVDNDRLASLAHVIGPIADTQQVPIRVVNSNLTELESGVYTYVSLMVPAADLLQQAVGLARRGAILNAFAGFAIGTKAALDLNRILGDHLYLVGTSGSRIADMVTVLRRLEAGVVDTNISLDAVCGIAGVPAAIESVNNRSSQGKIVVYPHLHNLELVRLVDMGERYPEVAAAMDGTRWTKQAEEVLLKTGGNSG